MTEQEKMEEMKKLTDKYNEILEMEKKFEIFRKAH